MDIESQDEYLTFFEATHVEKDGEIFKIIPSGSFAEFFIIPDEQDNEKRIRITLEDLNKHDYIPLELSNEVKMDSRTGVLADSIDHLNQMFDKKTTSILDCDGDMDPEM
jgi:hypothetical protein